MNRKLEAYTFKFGLDSLYNKGLINEYFRCTL